MVACGAASPARGPLYHFLKNRLYIGEIPHHDQSYPGEHQAIVDRALFYQVQSLLANNAVAQNAVMMLRIRACSPA